MNKLLNKKYDKKGSLTTVVLFLVLVISLIIYFGNNKNKENRYIYFYDSKSIDRFIEIPPYTERLTDSNKELIGECDLKIGTTLQQVNEFLKTYSHNCGFLFEEDKNIISITLRQGYVIKGSLKNNILELRWIPVLNKSLEDKAKKLFGKIKTPEIKEEE